MENLKRSAREIFSHHVGALGNKDIDGIMDDFSEEAVYISSRGVIAKGKQAIRKVYQQYFDSQTTGFKSTITQQIIEGNIVLLQWTSASPNGIQNGVDTFVIRDGYIQAQTATF